VGKQTEVISRYLSRWHLLRKGSL